MYKVRDSPLLSHDTGSTWKSDIIHLTGVKLRHREVQGCPVPCKVTWPGLVVTLGMAFPYSDPSMSFPGAPTCSNPPELWTGLLEAPPALLVPPVRHLEVLSDQTRG